MTKFSFGRTGGRAERGNNNMPEHSLESAGITKIYHFNFFFKTNLKSTCSPHSNTAT